MDENFKVGEKTVSEGASFAELQKIAKKQLLYQRVSALCFAGMFVVVLIAVLIVVPKVSVTLTHINDTAVKAQESLAKVDQMTASMEKASKELNDLVDQNGESLGAAIKSMTEVDYEGLNQAIQDLKNTIGPMADFMSVFH